MDYRERIVNDPKIHLGKPCVAGTRIPVENVSALVRNRIFERALQARQAQFVRRS